MQVTIGCRNILTKDDMRKEFPGYYDPSEADFKKLWSEGLFIFDTNVLLDLYRYSESTVSSLLSVMESLGDRIWIPFQVSKEYHKNLNKIISSQVKRYSDSIKTLTDFKKQIDEKRSHPFLEKELHEEITQFCEKFDTVLDTKKKEVKKLIINNPIKEKLADLLEGKLGEAFTDEELKKIYEEGETRYSKKIPPGYLDSKKGSPDKFGDLIVWKEILKKNSALDIPIVFVTGDTKDDWFLDEMGMTIGPRPELIEEISKEKDNLFYCYATDSFLKYAKEFLNVDVEEETIEEVGELLERTRKVEKTESEINGLNSAVESDSTGNITESESSQITSENEGSMCVG